MRSKAVRALLGGSTLLAALLSPAAKAATTYYLDVNGATSGFGIAASQTYDWDSTTNGGFWSTSSAGTAATNGWVQQNFPRFAPATSLTYTVTVSNNEQITGIFASTAQTLTINAIGSGSLEAISGVDGFLGSSGSSVTINAPIKGAGQLNFSNGGNLYLYGTNTYTGGTLLNTSAELVHFNNSSSFGTGTITVTESSGNLAPLLGAGGALITLPNNFVNTTSGGGVNFAADASTPVTSTGTWSLGANNLLLKNNGVSSSPLTLTNTISGTAGVTYEGANGGTIILTGANTYTGTTTVGASGAASVTLKLGAANTIASSKGVVLAGATLNPDGFNQAMTAAALGLTATSTIDFGAGASEVDFANSASQTWTGTLKLVNFDPSVDAIRFGTDATGLTATQLADITINGVSGASIDANGSVSVPEPASATLLLGGTLLLAKRRRRSAK